jgi:hypothetical protein
LTEEEQVKEREEKEKMKAKRKQEKTLRGKQRNNISFIHTSFPVSQFLQTQLSCRRNIKRTLSAALSITEI